MTDRIRTLTFVTNIDGVTVQLDRAQEQPGRGAHFTGQREFMGGPGHIPGLVQRVHVMSSHAFGEIRSYVLDETRVLRLAGPATPACGRRWTPRSPASSRPPCTPTPSASAARSSERRSAMQPLTDRLLFAPTRAAIRWARQSAVSRAARARLLRRRRCFAASAGMSPEALPRQLRWPWSGGFVALARTRGSSAGTSR